MMKVKERIAKLISYVFFNPVLLAIVILVVAVFYSAMTATERLSWVIAIIVLNGFIPAVFYLFFTSRGFVFDDTLANKKVQKERLLLIGLFLVLATLELLIVISAGRLHQPLLAVLVGGIAAIVIAGVISYFWKISMHSAMITFFVMAVILIFGWRVWPVLSFIPLVWWSRLVLRRHTIWQLMGGCLLSVILVYGVFKYFEMI